MAGSAVVASLSLDREVCQLARGDAALALLIERGEGGVDREPTQDLSGHDRLLGTEWVAPL